MGHVNWREYRWCRQSYIDRTGKVKEKAIQVYRDCRGTRQEFLATFKRKTLAWLSHRQHLEWDRMNQNNKDCSDACAGPHSQRVATMDLGDVHVRMDFIQNAEMHSPNEAQREFFVHQYLSLLCAVVQWKDLDEREQEFLRTQTIMFCSDDRKHDGTYTTHCLRHLVTQVLTKQYKFCSQSCSSFGL